jgi:predicted GIY-YIG superfamily endonuclease
MDKFEYLCSMINYIYALICPLSNQIRYIGKTNSVRVRYNAHLNDKSKSHKSSWIKHLKTKELKPKCIILEEVKDDASFWEQHWISLCKSWNYDLVNHTLGGENGCIGIYNPRGNAKLSKDDAVAIYNSNESADILVQRYNISKSTISGIKSGAIWQIYTNHKKTNKRIINRLPDEIKQEVSILFKTGEQIVKIEKLYNHIPQGTIRSYIKKHCI